MAQRRQAVNQVVSQGLSVRKALSIAGLSPSSYYYTPTGKPKGNRPSSVCWHRDGHCISNTELVEIIRQILGEEFIDYGYRRTTEALKHLGWQVNHKKVYRLMKQAHLLHPPIRKAQRTDKTYVEYTIPKADLPFSVVEVDIKYIWLHHLRRHGYLVSFLCVKTRFISAWELALTMTSQQIARVLQRFLAHEQVQYFAQGKPYLFRLRTDNGPQFISTKLSHALVEAGLEHEFIEPGTPQQNGHIEGFHSYVERCVCQGYELTNLEQAHELFTRFFHTYNYKRIMKGIGYQTPAQALQQWKDNPHWIHWALQKRKQEHDSKIH